MYGSVQISQCTCRRSYFTIARSLVYNWLRLVASLSAFSFPLLRSAHIASMALFFGSGVSALLVRVVIGLIWHRSIKPFLRPLRFFLYLLSLQHVSKMNGSRKGQLVWSKRRRWRGWWTFGALFSVVRHQTQTRK